MSSLVYRLDRVLHCLLKLMKMEELDLKRISILVVHMREELMVVLVKCSANVMRIVGAVAVDDGGAGDFVVEEAQLKNLSDQAQIFLGNHLQYDGAGYHDERICFRKVDTCDCVL